ncbi:MAG: hypothetical protein EU531_03230 [Promethearchaeota archaeon]|nr:MAG: hypothetical protein EU531_03230 [Candidatus Lokiarchaeota archaeon]
MRKVMIRKNTKILFIAGIFILTIVFSSIQFQSENQFATSEEPTELFSSTNLEGAEDLIITNLLRNVNVSAYGIINILDIITILNTYNNPISSMLVGIPLNLTDNLIFYQAKGSYANSLYVEKSNLIMNDNEMLTVYFDSPLLPNQNVTISFTHSYANIPSYFFLGDQQNIQYIINPFPILPYKTEKDVKAIFRMPENSEVGYNEKVEDIGVMILENIYVYDLDESFILDYLDPFLGNLKEEERQITITYQNSELTKMQIQSINREVFISAWGIIKIKEDIIIENIGELPIPEFSLEIPKSSKNLYVYDDIGDLDISDLSESEVNLGFSIFSITLAGKRAMLLPNSKYQFSIEYKLPFEEYTSFNWFEQSVKIDLLTSSHEFYVIEENVNIIIEGCNNIESLSLPPDAIIQSRGSTILTYNSKNVSPIETLIVQFTYSVDLFNLLLRPLTIMLILALIMSFYVVLIKTRKKQEEEDELRGEFIPFNEIREFCSLFEEKNALMLEIRRAEEQTKRKKMAKKTFKNILIKNSTKVDQIKQEILPFKKTLMDTNETFENIVKKLDILDAERISVDDSLNLLETRYKRGRLPSKAAYQKLSDDFIKRRKKIDRTIDKLIQQLRSYLL